MGPLPPTAGSAVLSAPRTVFPAPAVNVHEAPPPIRSGNTGGLPVRRPMMSPAATASCAGKVFTVLAVRGCIGGVPATTYVPGVPVARKTRNAICLPALEFALWLQEVITPPAAGTT